MASVIDEKGLPFVTMDYWSSKPCFTEFLNV